MKEVIIHCGFHKTGTTSLQASFSKSRVALAEHNINFPIFYSKINDQLANHSIPLYTIFSEKLDFYPPINKELLIHGLESVKENYKNQFVKILEDNQLNKIFFSGEDISLLTSRELNSLKLFIAKFNYSVKVIIFTRNPLGFSTSYIQQLVRSGFTLDTISEKDLIHQSVLLKNLSNVFDKEVNYFSYDELKDQEHGIIDIILNFLALNDRKNFIFETHNQSFSYQAIDLISFINKYFWQSYADDVWVPNALYQLHGEKFELNYSLFIKFKDYIHREIDSINNFYEKKNISISYPKIIDSKQKNFIHSHPSWSKTQLKELLFIIRKIDDERIKRLAYDYLVNSVNIDRGYIDRVLEKNQPHLLSSPVDSNISTYQESISETVDKQWYLQQYPDVAQANIDAEDHYKKYGYKENRRANSKSPPKTRKDKALFLIDKNKQGLEIGPSHNPLAPKNQGYNVHILDHASTEDLKSKYASHGINLENIEEVDFVWSGQSLQECVGTKNIYSWIIASHVIEHIPDLISFLQQCEIILESGGILSLVIPDKRYCFDFFNSLSSTGMILDAYLYGAKKPTPGNIFDHYSNASKIGDSIAWVEHSDLDLISLVHNESFAKSQFFHAKESENYIDVHCWRFIPESFSLIINDLKLLGLINFEIIQSFPTTGSEFYVSMKKQLIPTQPLTKNRLDILSKISSSLCALKT